MKSYHVFFWVLILNIVCVFYHAQEITSPLITTNYGSLKGTIGKTKGEGKNYFAYRGIPYAKPPIGELRFAAPVPIDPWNVTLDATKDKDECTQVESISVNLLPSESSIVGSEDCLFINVYTRNVTGRRPVMVWIYGGTFLTGSSRNDLYGPDYLLEKDIIFVDFNYRLGIFGFLSTEDLVAPGNWGLKDQVLALKWVKENIHKFGGDPDKITIFGESAGAASVSYLLQTNKTAGLYRGAIMQSGTTLCQWGLTRNAMDKTRAVALFLGNISSLLLDSKALVEQLRKVDYKKLKIAETRAQLASFLKNNPLHSLPFAVVKEPEHEGAVFTEKSYQQLVKGQFNQVPTIIGHNSFEDQLTVNYTTIVKLLLLKYAQNDELAPIDLSPSSDNLKKAQRAIVNKYFNGNLARPFNLFQLNTYLSVDSFNRPVRKTVQLMAKYSKVYFYEFSHAGTLGNPNRISNGVAHAEDLQYLFVSNNTASSSDILTRNRFVTFWTNFAKTLDPTSSDDHGLLQNIKWTPNTASTNPNELHYLNFNTTLAMEVNPYEGDWIFYDTDIYGKYGDPSYYDTY